MKQAILKEALRKERRLTLQYALAGGLFMGLAIWQDNPWLALPIYGVLLALLMLRYRRTEQVLRVRQDLQDANRLQKNPAG